MLALRTLDIVSDGACTALPDKIDPNMNTMPFILRVSAGYARGVIDRSQTSDDDEPLPAVVSTDVNGYLMERVTRLTKVAQETTDDN